MRKYDFSPKSNIITCNGQPVTPWAVTTRLMQLEKALADMLDLCQGSGPMPSQAEGDERCRNARRILDISLDKGASK